MFGKVLRIGLRGQVQQPLQKNVPPAELSRRRRLHWIDSDTVKRQKALRLSILASPPDWRNAAPLDPLPPKYATFARRLPAALSATVSPHDMPAKYATFAKRLPQALADAAGAVALENANNATATNPSQGADTIPLRPHVPSTDATPPGASRPPLSKGDATWGSTARG
jgi:hypothetical protein